LTDGRTDWLTRSSVIAACMAEDTMIVSELKDRLTDCPEMLSVAAPTQCWLRVYGGKILHEKPYETRLWLRLRRLLCFHQLVTITRPKVHFGAYLTQPWPFDPKIWGLHPCLNVR